MPEPEFNTVRLEGSGTEARSTVLGPVAIMRREKYAGLTKARHCARL